MKHLKLFFFPLLFILLSAGFLKVSYDATLIAPGDVPLTENLKEVAKKNQENLTTEKEAEVTNVTLKALSEAKSKYEKTIQEQLIGQLSIPSVGLDLPILRQANDLTLSTGAAQYFTDRKMGEGNYVLASHNFYGAPVLMYVIQDLKQGDEILVSDFTTQYHYQVVRNEVIEETQVDVIEETEKSTLTLLRCEGGENTPYRRLIVAEEVAKEPVGKAPEMIQMMDGSLKKNQTNTNEKGTTYQIFLQKITKSKKFRPISLKIGVIFDNEKNIVFSFSIWLITFLILTTIYFIYAKKNKKSNKK